MRKMREKEEREERENLRKIITYLTSEELTEYKVNLEFVPPISPEIKKSYKK